MPPKSDETPMDPKFEFWNDLPNEIRTECIKRMDFKTRIRLRATSKQDKLLVESAKKYNFDCVHVELDLHHGTSVICKKSGRSEVKIVRQTERIPVEVIVKTYKLSVQILKYSKTDYFDFSLIINDNSIISKFIADISNSTPFNFKNIVLDCEKFEIIDFFLKNCNSLETIELGCCGDGFETDKMMELINLPSVINAKVVQIVNLSSPEVPYQFITEWINKEDLGMGKTLQIRTPHTKIVGFLAEKCENNVVSKSSNTLRLHTNDPSKHILIREIINSPIGHEEYFSFLVIPSEQTESEYEKDDHWVWQNFKKEICRITGKNERDDSSDDND